MFDGIHRWQGISILLVFAAGLFTGPAAGGSDAAEVQLSGSGETVLTGRPGEVYRLPGEEIFIAFNGQRLPHVRFGNPEFQDGPDNLNSLPLRGELTIQGRNRAYLLSFLECRTETRFTDVLETWITDCDVSVVTREASGERNMPDEVTRRYWLDESKSAEYRRPWEGMLMREMPIHSDPFLKAFPGR